MNRTYTESGGPQSQPATPLNQAVLMPGAREELLLAALEACLRELKTLNAQVAALRAGANAK